MKRMISIGVILLAINTLVGLLLSVYSTFNTTLNSIVILAAILLMMWIQKVKLRTAFRIALTYMVIVIGCLEYVIGFFSKTGVEDNWVIILDIVLLTIEALFIIITNYITTKVIE